jgi:lipopolysaccharide export system protein LptA
MTQVVKNSDPVDWSCSVAGNGGGRGSALAPDAHLRGPFQMNRVLTALAAMALLMFLAPPDAGAQTKTETAAPAAPATETKKEPTDVTANEMEVIDAENKTIFRGEVVAVRGKTTIKCNQLLVDMIEVKQADGSTKKQTNVMHATGNVKITTENETITAARADIFDREDRLEAFDKVTLVQKNNTLKGEKLIVNLTTKHTVMSGGTVKGLFLPQ